MPNFLPQKKTKQNKKKEWRNEREEKGEKQKPKEKRVNLSCSKEHD